MVCRTCLIVLLLLLVSAVASRFKRELCIGIDVSRDPRIEARQVFIFCYNPFKFLYIAKYYYTILLPDICEIRLYMVQYVLT